MNARKTWSLALLTACLFALIWFFERPYRQERDRAPDPRILAGFDTGLLTHLQIRMGDRTDLRLQRTNGQWQVVRPFRYPASATSVNELLEALTTLQTQGHITSKELQGRPKAREEFGFAEPLCSIVLQQGEITTELLIGSPTFAGNQVFLQVVGGDGFHVVGSELLSLLPARPDDWRDLRAVPSEALAADGIEVRLGEKSFRLEINPTNRLWRLTRPIEARGNHPKITALLEKLATVQATGFVADGPETDFEKFGLGDAAGPASEFQMLFFSGTNLVGGLQTGAPVTTNTAQVYARRLDQETVFSMPSEALEPWRAPAFDFRDRRLLLFPSNAVTSIEISGPESFRIVRETNDTWTVSAPTPFPADAGTMHDLLLVLSQIEVNFESDVVTEWTQFGFTTPPLLRYAVRGWMTNALTGRMEELTELLDFGTNETERVFVRRNEARVCSIHPQEFELLPRTSWQLRPRRIWSFDPDQVVAVTIFQNNRQRRIIRNGPNQWALAPGSEGIINPMAIEEAMHRLGQLEALFWAGRGEDRETHGFHLLNYRLEIELRNNGKTERRELEIGDFSPFYHPYAATRIDGQRMIFEFPMPLYLEFIRRDLSIFPLPMPHPR